MAKKAISEGKETWPKGVAKPAQRALASAGYKSVDQLANAREEDLAALHGMGQKALDILRDALKQRGKTFSK
ncbi:MAG TPA: helix-hairpin-helix domain-containing protein [Terracidiphilus sp.]|nr:helix-hairpin-helix domain-containing protein [Terracidiphilus sp.]